LSLAAHEQRADQRDVADDRVQRIGRHDRALQIEPVPGEIGGAVGGRPDRAAISQQVVEQDVGAAEREVAAQLAERDAGAGQHAADPAEGWQRQDLGKNRGTHEMVIPALDVSGEDLFATDIRGLSGDRHPSADHVVGNRQEAQRGAEIIGVER
jgi:hypothetical protein